MVGQGHNLSVFSVSIAPRPPAQFPCNIGLGYSTVVLDKSFDEFKSIRRSQGVLTER
jgi:hypothetical protein